MWVEVGGAACTVKLSGSDNFKEFGVRSDASPALTSAVLAHESLGVVEDGHAFLDPTVVRRLVPEPTEEWSAGFDSMIAYAVSKGWADDQGRIRAHIEGPTA